MVSQIPALSLHGLLPSYQKYLPWDLDLSLVVHVLLYVLGFVGLFCWSQQRHRKGPPLPWSQDIVLQPAGAGCSSLSEISFYLAETALLKLPQGFLFSLFGYI